MSERVFRLFLSSPGDVAIERRRIAGVVSRLNGECAGRARIDVIRWETETYQAHATFQAQIPQSVECDLVLTLFKWRLGTELPPDFERMPTGETYPSGTAYELLTAMEARRQGAETPDVFVYRYTGSAPRPAIDDPDRERVEQEWRRLQGFFERWFLTPEGHFRAAFQTYATEDDLDDQIEHLLRRWLTEKVAAGRILAWPDAIKGSPFPGLESYGRRHAAVFFGRGRDVARAVEQWRDVAERGHPVLLVVGASGSGKSSLAKAGLLPRVTTPGVIESVDLWRAASFRPGDSPDGPLTALAASLLTDVRDLPAAEEGRGPALPELAAGGLGDATALASLLASDPAAGAAAVVDALDAIGAAEQAREKRARPVRADLVVVLDQLDEVFAPSLDPASRDDFVAALTALAATGRVWIVATLRADLYAAMLEHPGLKALKEAGATYDLAPPGPAELAEIVRRPAEAADLVFGTDPATGESVDERLLAEADRPDMLPLVQLALARLYEGRREEANPEGERTVLPFDVYAGLGGLTGIIDEVGERALAGLSPAAVRSLPQLTRSLARLETEGGLAGTLTVTPRPLAEIAPDEARRALVAALVGARLLTLSDTGDGSLVRLAHQRVLTDWGRTREIVQGSADFYRIHGEIERRRLRWEENRRADLLLPRGLPLAEAEDVVARYGEEIAPETRAFVRASRARAGRAQMLTGAAAVIFALVAIGALFQWTIARQQTQLAQTNFGVAREAVRGVVFDVVQGLSDVSGMRLDSLRTILSTVRKAADKLAGTSPGDPDLLRTRAAMFDNFARMYAGIGDIPAARTSADDAVAILRDLAKTRPEDVRVESDLGIVIVTRGTIDAQSGDVSRARQHFEEALRLARIGAQRGAADPELRKRVMVPLDRLGDARLTLGDYRGARDAYREQVEVARRELGIDPTSAALRDGLAKALFNLGYLGMESGDLDLAATSYEEAARIARALADEFPASPGMQRGLSSMLGNLGKLDARLGRAREAIARYDESVAIERRLVREDPQNAERQRTLAISLEFRGEGASALSDWPTALKVHSEQLEIFRGLVARNSLDLRNQRSLAIALAEIGAVRREMGEEPAARAAFEERLAITRRLAETQPDNAEAKTDLTIALRDMAETRERAGEAAGGLALRQEGLVLARALAKLDPDNVKPMQLLQELLRALAQIQTEAGDDAGTLASFEEEAGVLRRMIVLRPGEANLRALLGTALLQIGAHKGGLDDRAGTFAALDESVSVLRDLVAMGDPRGPRFLDYVLDVSARMGAAFGDTARSLDAYRALLALRRERLAREGGPQRRIELAGAAIAVAKLAPDDALLREAVALLDGLPEADRTDDSRKLRAEADTLLDKAPG
ncbi:AAA family ATPase [Enterovirga rhinocerotis]|uniref:Tetratricopeptide repeat protein n=1 Tax=Enterovirga rhinocerotis TaxID=1339210 RepID=A0A4R7C8A1_9HYPH|nr:AAA family ATPase [Enterovirga rhinocerotis]TDR94854.1 tetratricopeptide repeat protein [Enterovirga rhinocerotis]